MALSPELSKPDLSKNATNVDRRRSQMPDKTERMKGSDMASTNRVSVYSKLRRKETDALSSQQQLTEDGTYCAFANFKRHMG